jgi:hypothetical protein
MRNIALLFTIAGISIKTRNWRIATPLALRLLCIVIALQALGMRQLIASDAALKEPARSVVLIDSQLVASIPKVELAGSKVIPIDGNGDIIAEITKDRLPPRNIPDRALFGSLIQKLIKYARSVTFNLIGR